MLHKIHPSYVLDLPNEILAIIINELASDDEDNDETLAALASCRLAFHVLCSFATPLFFSSIRLTNSTGHKRDRRILVEQATRLNEILTNYNIAVSVHTLTLCFDHQTLEDSTSVALMSDILHRLPHIRNFALETYRYTDFSSFPEDFASAIRALCRSPNLTTLCLDSIQDFPFTAIMGCPNLRCLRLGYVNDLGVNPIFFGTFFSQQLTLHSSSTTNRRMRYHAYIWIL
jgi:hypothetical protein